MISSDRKAITSAQLRAARALIRWSAQELAERSHVGVATIRRAENKEGPIATTDANAHILRQTLEEAGVVFVNENGEGPGVRLAKR